MVQFDQLFQYKSTFLIYIDFFDLLVDSFDLLIDFFNLSINFYRSFNQKEIENNRFKSEIDWNCNQQYNLVVGIRIGRKSTIEFGRLENPIVDDSICRSASPTLSVAFVRDVVFRRDTIYTYLYTVNVRNQDIWSLNLSEI